MQVLPEMYRDYMTKLHLDRLRADVLISEASALTGLPEFRIRHIEGGAQPHRHEVRCLYHAYRVALSKRPGR